MGSSFPTCNMQSTSIAAVHQFHGRRVAGVERRYIHWTANGRGQGIPRNADEEVR